MSARRILVLCAVLSFIVAPLSALPAGWTAEAAPLPSSQTAETAQAPQAQPVQAETKADQAAEAATPTEVKPAPAKKAPAVRTEPIVPAFQTPKEKTAVIVFYVWMWLSIGILIYFLRWWVQEADRVFKARFYEPVESPRKDNPFPPYLGE